MSESERLARLREAYNLCTHYLGCGDNSCMFVKPRGMATNGGCRCLGRGEGKPGAAPALGRLFKAVEALLAAPGATDG